MDPQIETETSQPQAEQAVIDAPPWLRQTVEGIIRELAPQRAAQPLSDTAASPIIGYAELQRRLPMYCDRDLRAKIKRGVIPVIRPPGSRKLAFYWPSVEAALLRFQRGGGL